MLSVSSVQPNRLVASLLTSNPIGCFEQCIEAQQNISNEQTDFVIFEKKKKFGLGKKHRAGVLTLKDGTKKQQVYENGELVFERDYEDWPV